MSAALDHVHRRRAGSRITGTSSTAPNCSSASEGIARMGQRSRRGRGGDGHRRRRGLAGTWAALEAGKTVAVANKETLVMAGPLVMDLAARNGAGSCRWIASTAPFFRRMQAGGPGEVERVVLTASGGPFRGARPADLAEVTVEEALQHPTWRMGPKITVDSATLMNKALEVIEARWLFDLPPEQIEVIIHPESMIHSFVEFTRRLGAGPAVAAGHAVADPVCVDVSGAAVRAGAAAELARIGSLAFRAARPGDVSRPYNWDTRSPAAAGRAGPCSTRPTRRPWADFWPAAALPRHSPRLPATCLPIINFSPRPTLAELTAWTAGLDRR